MPNQTNSTKRAAPAKKSGVGLKALIMAASVGITLGGWGVLAASQAQNALAAAPQSQAVVQPANSATFQGQSSAPLARPLAITRTRSSR